MVLPGHREERRHLAIHLVPRAPIEGHDQIAMLTTSSNHANETLVVVVITWLIRFLLH